MEITAFAHDSRVGLTSAAVWFGGLLMIVVSITSGAAIHRALDPARRVTRELGNLSYPLYLNHYVLGAAVTPVMWTLLGPFWALAGALFVVVGSSLIISMYLEKPLQGAFKSLFRSKSPQKGPPQPSPGAGA